ncbi:MFS transporter [Streptomyces melanosporofaciens]|uniref:MFS transporter, MHS family, proline/betaine transporter n=1 Tax=Streptomyces melanosporofaciens TaxID=67327 RepID=A0A1H5CCW9_STRMJ|nr:MFS transporter [Streptomyces melanosporofaciens]SED64170.1 MFS transporter, MHS family, proline/betaine transporter [Streptomyces melanosporofaciens]
MRPVEAEAVEAHQPQFRPQAVRRSALAGAIGNLIEYYDFSVYGYVVVVIAPQFFPSDDPTTSTLLALAVFGTAFVPKLVGGVFFGWLGDRVSRRTALVSSVLCMGVAASVTGMLPTYHQIGVAAPALLVVTRLVQGFSTGGEAAGSITYVYESVPSRRRAVLGSLNYVGSNLGFVLAAIITGGVVALTSKEQMADWGWRIPFLVAVPLTLLCLWARLRLEDTPEFTEAARRSSLPNAPVREAIATHRKAVAQVVGVMIAQSGCMFLALTYLNIYLSNELNYSAELVQWLSALAGLAGVVLMVPAGWLAGRYGPRRVLLVGFLGMLVIVYPAMLMMGRNNLALAGVGQVVVMMWGAIIQAPVAVLFPRLFERRVRFSGMALGYNIGTVLAGGTGPYIAAYLVAATGNVQSPSFCVMAVCAIGIGSLLTIKKTVDKEYLHSSLQVGMDRTGSIAEH